MTTKHTPGPWIVGSQVHGDGFNLYSEGAQDVVAWVAPRTFEDPDNPGEFSTRPTDFQLHPDARLIAAAPALLEACKKCLAYFQETRSGRDWVEQGSDEVYALRAAIRAAEGE